MTASPLDDFANTLSGAATIEWGSAPPIQIGNIDYPGDVDTFQIKAPSTGSLFAHLFAGRSSTLDAFLIVHDETGQEIARNDNLASDVLDSQVAFEVVADHTYYFEV